MENFDTKKKSENLFSRFGGAENKSPKINKKIIIAIMVVILVITIGIIYFMAYKNKPQEKILTPEEQKAQVLKNLADSSQNVAIDEKQKAEILKNLSDESKNVKISDEEKAEILNNLSK